MLRSHDRQVIELRFAFFLSRWEYRSSNSTLHIVHNSRRPRFHELAAIRPWSETLQNLKKQPTIPCIPRRSLVDMSLTIRRAGLVNVSRRRRSFQLVLTTRFKSNETGANAPKSNQIPSNGLEPPLKGIKIVDLTRVLAAPLATMLLADLGADVIKIEEPTKGDDTRKSTDICNILHAFNADVGSWYPPYAKTVDTAPPETAHLPPEAAYFLSANRNKRSLGLNFKHPDGLAVLYKLIKDADILVENFVAGKLAKMGLGYEDCQKINPRLIYASVTGTYLHLFSEFHS